MGQMTQDTGKRCYGAAAAILAVPPPAYRRECLNRGGLYAAVLPLPRLRTSLFSRGFTTQNSLLHSTSDPSHRRIARRVLVLFVLELQTKDNFDSYSGIGLFCRDLLSGFLMNIGQIHFACTGGETLRENKGAGHLCFTHFCQTTEEMGGSRRLNLPTFRVKSSLRDESFPMTGTS